MCDTFFENKLYIGKLVLVDAIICLGNEFRADDALGPMVGKWLNDYKKLHNNPNCKIIIEQGDTSHLINYFEEYQNIIIVDCIKSDKLIYGSLFECDLNHIQKQKPNLLPTSSHAVDILQAIRLAQTLNYKIPNIKVFGIVGRNFNMNADLSETVQKNFHNLCELVICHCDK